MNHSSFLMSSIFAGSDHRRARTASESWPRQQNGREQGWSKSADARV